MPWRLILRGKRCCAASVITPYQITEQRDTITELLAANGNKPLISHRESIEQLGWSANASDTLSEIQQESTLNAYEIAE